MNLKRPVAIFLSIIMLLSMMPSTAFAEDTVFADDEFIEETVPDIAEDEEPAADEAAPAEDEIHGNETPAVPEEGDAEDDAADEPLPAQPSDVVPADDENQPGGDEIADDEPAQEEIPAQPDEEEEDNDFVASTAGVITNASLISGYDYTSDSTLASKLNAIFNGNASIFYDSACKQPVDTSLGTRSVPNNGVYMYIGTKNQGSVWSASSCWVLANGVYYTLFGETTGNGKTGSRSETLSAAEGGTISYANFQKWGVRSGVGALVRVGGHSFVVLRYTSSTLTYIDGNGDAKGLVAVRNVSWGYWGNYSIEYITQPKQSTMNSLYPGDGSSGGSSGGTAVSLPAPVLLSAANYENYIKVTWEPVSGAELYRLSYREGTGDWVKVSDTTGTAINVTAVKDGATYTFKVECYSKDGRTKVSPESNRVGQMRLTTPTVKVSRFGTANESGGFYVMWNATEGGSAYKIYYREKGGSWVLYTMIPKSRNTLYCNIKASVTNSSAGMTNLVPGRTYEFMVLTCTSVAHVTSGYPTPFVSMTY